MDVSIDFSSDERNELLQILAREIEEAKQNIEVRGPDVVKRGWLDHIRTTSALMTKIMTASPR